jgi:DNA-binding LytR/AlgR family response regulator
MGGNSLMQKKILVLENKKNYIRILKEIEKNITDDVDFIYACNVNEGIAAAMHMKIDIFIADFDIRAVNGMTGIDFIENIRHFDKYRFTPVIALSEAEDPAKYVYEKLHCYSYITKPLNEDYLKSVISEVLLFNHVTVSEYGFFKIDGVFHMIKAKDIVHVELHSKEIIIITPKCKYNVPYITCDQFLAKYKSDAFIRCSKNAIVNVNYIQSVDMTNRFIQLVDNYGHIGIGMAYKKNILVK